MQQVLRRSRNIVKRNASLRRLQQQMSRFLKHQIHIRRYEKSFREQLTTLPPAFHSAAELIFTGQWTAQEQALVQKIESLRKSVTTLSSEVYSYSSPRSRHFQVDQSGHIVPGALGKRDPASAARTGASPMKGVLIRRITTHYDVQDIFELGTNIGISGCYFASVEKPITFTSVEGSESLSNIASKNISRFTSRHNIMNMLFDEAIDQLLEANEPQFDMVFLDGQHQKEASEHYVQRVLPLMREKSCFVFDDIRWSEGMYTFWEDMTRSDLFEYTIDFGSIGVGVRRHTATPRRHFNLTRFLHSSPRIRTNEEVDRLIEAAETASVDEER